MTSLILVGGLSALVTLAMCRWWAGRSGVSRSLHVSMSQHLEALQGLAQTIDANSQTGADHLSRVQRYAGALAEVLGAPPSDVLEVRVAAVLHDIGMLAVPDDLLSKSGPLTDEEWRRVQSHTRIGADLLSAPTYSPGVAAIVRGHHERWDGGGYPEGLQGTAIPLGARVLAVVDCFDVTTSDRPYHRSMREEAAVRLLRQEAGKAFDPDVVDAYVRLLPTLRERGDASVRVDAAFVAALGDISRSRREQQVLAEIARARGTTLGVPALMALVASKVATLVPFSAFAYFDAPDEGDVLACRFATGTDAAMLKGLRIRLGEGDTGWVALHRQPLVNRSPLQDFRAGGATTDTLLQASLVCPLMASGRLLGTLGLYHTDASSYADEHHRLLSRVADEVAATLYHSLDVEQARADALTDALTGLPNQRFMLSHLEKELARAQRLNSQVALMVLDIDNFKEINDQHGHQAGDRALQAVADVLRTGIRPYDTCVRYAGDEFVVVLPDCGRGESDRKLRELQQAVALARLHCPEGRPVSLRISAGTAVFPDDGRTWESLVAHADRRMYGDKAQHRGAGR